MVHNEDIIHLIDMLIQNSRFYIYDSDKEYQESIDKLYKARKLLEDGKYDKVFSEGGVDDDT